MTDNFPLIALFGNPKLHRSPVEDAKIKEWSTMCSDERRDDRGGKLWRNKRFETHSGADTWRLFIAGTRITLYDVMDYLVADWPPQLIRRG